VRTVLFLCHVHDKELTYAFTERNHNIRIPGFASDDTRMAISQSAGALGSGGAGAGNRRTVHMTLRSARLNAVQAAKRDGKLL